MWIWLRHTGQMWGALSQWFRENAPDWRALHDPENQLPHNYSCPQAYRTPIPEDLYPTAYIRDSAISYLKSRQDQDAPFLPLSAFLILIIRLIRRANIGICIAQMILR